MRSALLFFFLFFLWGVLAFSIPADASVVINEVLFNPSSSSDAGLEKIELYNPDAASQDMGGWELYPGYSSGYFVFPQSFALAAKSFVTIHLKLAGANDGFNLFHSAATADNMGDSSGSVALFSAVGHPGDSIVDFVRYHKPGSSEKKTWESAAEVAGLWAAGEFVDISNLAVGSSIGLISDGIRANAASWRIHQTPSIGSANGVSSGGSQDQSATSTPKTAPASIGPSPTPSLGADAGPDATAIAGAVLQFRGMAFGLDGEPLPSARFLWNFGDGSVQEGKSLTHVYYFPGIYRANLSISSGEYTGSDWRVIAVIPPDLTISEAKPGDNGFVELFNASEEDIDLGGINFTDQARNIFRIPLGTLAGAEAAIVFPNAVTGLNPQSSLILRDARSSILDEAKFSGPIGADASWERSGGIFIVQAGPTPGKFSPRSKEEPAASKAAPAPPLISAAGSSAASNSNRANPESADSTATVAGPPASPVQPAPAPKTGALASVISARIFFAASVVLGIISAAGFIILKRTAR